MNNSIVKGFIWKLSERFSVFGIQFVLQIILARLLSPEHYGVLSVMMIFINLANVFIQTGFNTALIQDKDVEETDYSSVFWVSLFVALCIYIVIFISTPFIGEFYNMPDLVSPLRVLALMLFPGAFNSIQIAKISRDLNFKEIFKSNLIGVIISGLISIYMAYCGAGLWALVFQTLINAIVVSVVMVFTVKWKPVFVLNISRINPISLIRTPL